MTMPIGTISRCFVCGEESDQTVLASTNAFGYADLDLRPPEMERSTMCWWIQECPHCGYVASDLSDETSLTKEWFASEKYRTAEGRSCKSELAIKFHKHYLVSKEEEKTEAAFHAAMHAAWACDDAGDTENAIFYRERALTELDKMIAECEKDSEKNAETLETYHLIRFDLLRRSRHFADLICEFPTLKFTPGTLDFVALFQFELAFKGDTACYTVGDAIEHVSPHFS